MRPEKAFCWQEEFPCKRKKKRSEEEFQGTMASLLMVAKLPSLMPFLDSPSMVPFRPSATRFVPVPLRGVTRCVSVPSPAFPSYTKKTPAFVHRSLLSVPALPMEQPAPVTFLLERRACVADVLIPFIGNGYRPELTTVVEHIVVAFNARHIER